MNGLHWFNFCSNEWNLEGQLFAWMSNEPEVKSVYDLKVSWLNKWDLSASFTEIQPEYWLLDWTEAHEISEFLVYDFL